MCSHLLVRLSGFIDIVLDDVLLTVRNCYVKDFHSINKLFYRFIMKMISWLFNLLLFLLCKSNII